MNIKCLSCGDIVHFPELDDVMRGITQVCPGCGLQITIWFDPDGHIPPHAPLGQALEDAERLTGHEETLN